MSPGPWTRREGWTALLASVVIAAAFTAPLFAAWSHWGIEDWDQHLFYHEVPRLTVARYGQVPLWNPYSCGGMVMLANPQSRVLSTALPLTLIFGTAPGVKVDVALHVAIALFSTYVLARRSGLARPASALASAVFSLSGLAVYPLVAGMTWATTVAFVPAALLGYLESAQRPRWLWLSAAAFALMVGGGGVYVAAITGVLLATHAALDLLATRRATRLLRAAAIAPLAAGLAAVKLFPCVESMRRFPRHWDDYAGYSVAGLVRGLFDRCIADHGPFKVDGGRGFWQGTTYGFDENFLYVGVVPAALCVVGVALAPRKTWRLAAAGLLCLWLAFGSRAPVSAWDALHQLPVFDSMRVAQRFRIAFMIAGALIAGFGLQSLQDALARRGHARAARVGAAALVLLVVADLFATNAPAWAWAFPVPPPPIEPAGEFRQTNEPRIYDARGIKPDDDPYRWREGPASSLFLTVQENVGVIGAYESAEVSRNAVAYHDAFAPGEAFVTGARGTARIERWSPNAVRVSARVESGEGWLILNQNYDPNWRASGDRAVESVRVRFGGQFLENAGDRGLVAVRLGPGAHEVELRYLPTSFLVGACVSAATILAAILTLRRRACSRPGAPAPCASAA